MAFAHLLSSPVSYIFCEAAAFRSLFLVRLYPVYIDFASVTALRTLCSSCFPMHRFAWGQVICTWENTKELLWKKPPEPKFGRPVFSSLSNQYDREMLLHLLQFLLRPASFPCRLVCKELINLLLCLFDNGIQTCSLQLFDTSGNCSCRIRCTGQQVILVLIPNSVAVCDLVLNIGYIQSKAQAGRRCSRFI